MRRGPSGNTRGAPSTRTTAPFTEALLVGELPVRLGKRIEWDAAAMRATNAPEADLLIRKPYRKGFELPG